MIVITHLFQQLLYCFKHCIQLLYCLTFIHFIINLITRFKVHHLLLFKYLIEDIIVTFYC